MGEFEEAGVAHDQPGSALVLGGQVLPMAGRARVYACGIRPREVAHLGHAATFVWVDALSRVLRLAGVETIACRNVTDVDGLLLAAGHAAGEPYGQSAEVHQFYFDHDMALLGVGAPDIQPRAHSYVRNVIALAAGLLRRGAAYHRDGSVYFRGAAAARAAVPEAAAALRLAAEHGHDPEDPRKEDPLDIAVWHAARDGQPAWMSPWGSGWPGWHAECAAIALQEFGPAVDILAGGADLRFPHHAYQAALAEAFTGVTPFARATFSVGVVRSGGAAMSGRAGNVVPVSDLLAKYPAAALRMLLLDRRWGEDWDYDPPDLEAAAARVDRLRSAAGRADRSRRDAATRGILAALARDLDVPAALAIAEEAGGRAASLLSSLLGL